ncbi:GTP-binding protein [Paracoccus mutanolyticus]|uniref:GTP-binding protein n=1 Tax=Paracoccus mutanolyticus TaxID=1499308 RepID=UPI0037CB3931
MKFRRPGAEAEGSIGGPVGCGKTRLVERLLPICKDAGVSVAVITNDLVTPDIMALRVGRLPVAAGGAGCGGRAPRTRPGGAAGSDAPSTDRGRLGRSGPHGFARSAAPLGPGAPSVSAAHRARHSSAPRPAPPAPLPRGPAGRHPRRRGAGGNAGGGSARPPAPRRWWPASARVRLGRGIRRSRSCWTEAGRQLAPALAAFVDPASSTSACSP